MMILWLLADDWCKAYRVPADNEPYSGARNQTESLGGGGNCRFPVPRLSGSGSLYQSGNDERTPTFAVPTSAPACCLLFVVVHFGSRTQIRL